MEYETEFIERNIYSPHSEDYCELREQNFQESFYINFASPKISQNEFLENFMKIDHDQSSLLREQRIISESSSQSSLNANNLSNNQNDMYVSTDSGNTQKEPATMKEICNKEIMFIKNKIGRPMADSNVIFDEVTNNVYYPDVDPEGYKKARK